MSFSYKILLHANKATYLLRSPHYTKNGHITLKFQGHFFLESNFKTTNNLQIQSGIHRLQHFL